MSARPKFLADKKARYLDTSLFKVRYGQDSLTCQMRMLYNIKNGAAIFIRKRGESWLVHSVPFPGPLPKTEVDRLFEIFKNSALKCDKRVKFSMHQGVPKNDRRK